MENLLNETLETLSAMGASPDDVSYVGTIDGEWQIDWPAFAVIADAEYDAGYGAAEVASDLVVVLKDGRYLQRTEYDGSEGWTWTTPPAPRREDARAFSSVLKNGGLWPQLVDLNGEVD